MLKFANFRWFQNFWISRFQASKIKIYSKSVQNHYIRSNWYQISQIGQKRVHFQRNFRVPDNSWKIPGIMDLWNSALKIKVQYPTCWYLQNSGDSRISECPDSRLQKSRDTPKAYRIFRLGWIDTQCVKFSKKIGYIQRNSRVPYDSWKISGWILYS